MSKERVRPRLKEAAPNMTSMIDVVFLLISFFTLVMNFSQAEQNEEIALPVSELAQPPEAAPPEQIAIQAFGDRSLLLGTLPCSLDDGGAPETSSFAGALKEELRVLKAIRRVDAKDVTIIIRGDELLETGFIQTIISVCQEQGLDAFVLRARQRADGF